jgi:UPF0271 protein
MKTNPPTLDLNCDLAEGEPPEHTAALMRLISSANIACGGHAGDDRSMSHAIQLAHQSGVHIGAHPGLPGNFGRGSVETLSADAFLSQVRPQIQRCLNQVTAVGGRLHHVKLHGALYHATEHTAALRTAYISLLHELCPEAVVYALASGQTVAAARASGLQAWDEAFIDRAYGSDGHLIPRGQPGAVLTDPEIITTRVAALRRGAPIVSTDGTPLPLDPQTLCLHGDTPDSLRLLQAARTALQ